MTKKQQIKLFEDKKVRVAWDGEQEQWYFSIVDVCGVLTEQPDYDGAKNYWNQPRTSRPCQRIPKTEGTNIPSP